MTDRDSGVLLMRTWDDGEAEIEALGAGLIGLAAHVVGAGETRNAALANYQRKMDDAHSGWMTPEG